MNNTNFCHQCADPNAGNSTEDTSAEENFVSEKQASHFASLYKKRELPGGHVIMLGKGNKEAALDALKAYPGGMQVNRLMSA